MGNNKKVKGAVVGAALGSLLGSLASLLAPEHAEKGWASKAKSLGSNLFEDILKTTEGNGTIPDFVKGALVGLVLGAGSATLLTPSTGKNVRKNLSKGYQNISEKTQDILHFIQKNANGAAIKRRAGKLLAKVPHLTIKKRKTTTTTTVTRKKRSKAKR